MNIRPAAIVISLALLASVGVSTTASAQGLSRAEVRQQLIDAENHGSRFVSDTSYPDVSPVFAQQVANIEQGNSSVGGVVSGNSEAGAPRAKVRAATSSACVGPVSFCTPYFGS